LEDKSVGAGADPINRYQLHPKLFDNGILPDDWLKTAHHAHEYK